ncbi:hypothetical protein LCGC14_1908330 [marine sediment metagenome]|uniref:Uncharacterized protein n=1 Tax=marine sediment metagenome TaxID=412755 RepID=A0A0F9I8E3_9ZZZZ
MICDSCKEEIKGGIYTSVLFGKVINGKTVVKICENCEKLEEEHIKEVTRKNRKDVVVLYCHSIEELKRKEIDWDTFSKDKFK